MFESLFKPKFYIKCKKALKVTRTRIEIIKKKSEAVQKFMKDDIVEFLKGGFDLEAYHKAEDLLLEKNLWSCYDQIEEFCRCVADNISIMQKQSECPEECVEAVQSLMHAAARVPKLRELRDLRSLFVKKYGDSLQHGVNEEFLGKLKANPPAKELKLQLIHDIAFEASIDWASKALEQKLFVPPLPNEDKSYELESTEHHAQNNYALLQESSDHTAAERESQEAVNKLCDTGEHTEIKESEKDIKSYEVKDTTVCIDKYSISRKGEVLGVAVENYSSKEAETQSSTSLETGCNDKLNSKTGLSFSNIPPPYVKKPREHQGTSSNFTVSNKDIVNSKNSEHILTQGKEKVFLQSDDTGWPGSRRTRKAPPTARAASLSPHYTGQAEAPKVKTRHNRAASLEPEMLARHVHPKQPDYDELVLYFAALRGK